MQRRLHRLLTLTLLVLWAAGPVHARLGEKMADLRSRFGKPEAQLQKNAFIWLIEENAGALVYSVTFNEQGISIAEGLKPLRQSKLTEQSAQNFIGEQLATLPAGNTAHEVKTGESYTFAGEKFTCGTNERVVVDDTNGLLIVWTFAPNPNVLAVTRELVTRTRR